uniref:Uncharacterized protein n=1 Tax=Caenorhabditis japonica TaxID=281687 RepID=A0A8R1IK14_CAEJA
MDVIYGEAFRKKMCHLKVLLNEIIVRTSINEKAMCKEIGHQEGEFENRLKEAIYGRSRANLKVEEAQAKCEVMIREQANLYEDVRELEENLEKYGASRWLLNVEKRRVADILDQLPVLCNPPNSVVEVPNVQIPTHQHHKEGCPKRKSSQLHPIPHSASLISQKVPKKCPVHMNEKEEKKDASTLHLPINGINLMELISKAIEEELYSL